MESCDSGHSGGMVSIVEVPPPASVDDPNAWAALVDAELWNAENLALFGYPDLNDTAAAAARLAVPSAHRRTLRWLALDDPDDSSSAVGSVTCSMTLQDNLTVAGVHPIVRLDRRRQGIGSSLFDTAKARAVAEGRTTLQTWATQVASTAATDVGALSPREGSGFIDSTSASAAFLLSRGFTLEQVEVHSMLPLPVPAKVIDPLAESSSAASAEDYRLVSWVDRCPDAWVDAYARARSAMIDAPAAGMVVEAALWNAARVRELEQRLAEAGMTTVCSAAQHIGSGELAGYTQLERFADRHDSAFQEDTVVVAEHRGHRLGMRLKIANLRLVAEKWPQVRRIHTWNADENDFMRSINIALGFRPESVEGAWQKVVG